MKLCNWDQYKKSFEQHASFMLFFFFFLGNHFIYSFIIIPHHHYTMWKWNLYSHQFQDKFVCTDVTFFSLHLHTKSMIMNYSFLFLFAALCVHRFTSKREEKKDKSDDVEHMCFTFKSYTITASLDKLFFSRCPHEKNECKQQATSFMTLIYLWKI